MRLKLMSLAEIPLVATLSCTETDDSSNRVVPNQDLVMGLGTITYVSAEGGFYAIQSDDGPLYDPLSLPENLQVDGQRVRFTVRVRDDLIGFHQVGPIVEVVDIERRQ